LVEDVALDQRVGVLTYVESVAGIFEPVVVIGVPEAVELELWGAPGGVVNVIASEGYVVALSVAETVEWSLA
jgi:hypothetical protein